MRSKLLYLLIAIGGQLVMVDRDYGVPPVD